MIDKRATPKKFSKVIVASVVGCSLLLGGTTYALWNSTATVNSAGIITNGDLQVSANAPQKWIDITNPDAPVTLNSLEDFLLVPGDKLQLTQTMNVIVVGDNITGKLKVLIPNTTASASLLAQTKFTLTLLDKNDVPLGTITPDLNSENSLELEAVDLLQTVPTGETYKAQVTVELPSTSDNATKVQAGALEDMVITLNQGSSYVAPYPTANSADDFAFTNGPEGGAIITGYVGDSKDVVIPETLRIGRLNQPVVAIAESAFWNKGLTSIVMPDTVTSIAAQAFQSNNLTAVQLPKSLETIGFAAFNSNALTSVSIPDSVTAIEMAAFNSNRITSVKLSKSLTTISNMAFSDNLITSVVIPNGVQSIEDAAFNNTKLTSVTIPGSVTSIGANAFTSTNVAGLNIYFEGNAPSVGANPFSSSGGTKIYYHANATGFSNPWKGNPAVIY